MVEVYVNSKFVGEVEDADKFVSQFIEERRTGTIDKNCNIYFNRDTKEVHVETSRGRVLRPLIVIKNGKCMFTDKHAEQLTKGEISWSDLVTQGVVEYLDALEEEGAYVAFSDDEITPEHTHMEVHPIDLLGVTTALVPYANFSHGVKVATGAKNQKQSIGFYASNFHIRMDMDTNILHTPQAPLVKSIIHDLTEQDRHPSGQNIVLAVMSYKGYNMDDAIMINQASLDRGFGRNTYFRPAVAEELRYAGGLTDEISIPDKDIKGYKSEIDYKFLEEEGIIYPEAKVREGDVIIGKTSPPRFLNSLDEYNLAQTSRRESSVSLRYGEEGIVDTVVLTENGEGNKLVQVRLREQRIPETGDKFISRHGQKGVVGLVIPAADMPFTASGITPDVIFSAHSIPTRMTISHLIELVAAKTAALTGRFIDGTTFDADDEGDIRKDLLALGFRDDGTESMYNGETGEKLTTKIYIGNMHFLKLKHMVANKLQSRALGPIQLLTRQPTEGRAKEGGLRLGEMEKDTFVAHGASLLLQERFAADKVIVPVCEKSGLIGYVDARKNKAISPIYKEEGEMSYVEISYAFKLFLDELKSMGICPQLKLENKF